MRTKKFFIGILILVIGISGCGSNITDLGDSSAAGNTPRAWFDAPLPRTVIFPTSPCQIVAHAASINGIALFELTINGAASSFPSPDTQNLLVTLSRACDLSQPGDYRLLLRAQDNAGNWSGFAETSLTIATEETANSTPTTTEPTASETASPTPITGRVSIERISTNQVYLGRAVCGPLEVTITARAIAPAGIKIVMLFYRFQTGNTSTEFTGFVMNSIGSDLYALSLNPNTLLGGSVPFNHPTLEYQVVAQQNGEGPKLSTPVMSDIAITTCLR